MSFCKNCGHEIDWGFMDGKWVPLEPVASHAEMDRRYVDENGVLRADHRDRHEEGTTTVNVERLIKKVPAAVAEGANLPDPVKERRRRRRQHA